jgi:hypothetical protein
MRSHYANFAVFTDGSFARRPATLFTEHAAIFQTPPISPVSFSDARLLFSLYASATTTVLKMSGRRYFDMLPFSLQKSIFP